MIGTVITAILMITFLQPASTVIDEEAYFGDILASDASHLLRHTYLEETQPTQVLKFFGIMWGIHRGLFINLPVKLRDKNCPKVINVIFKVDTGAGITTLTKEVLEKLHSLCPSASRDQTERLIEIHHRVILAGNSTAYFANVNTMGSNFMHRHNIRLTANYSQQVPEKFEMEFDANKMKESQQL